MDWICIRRKEGETIMRLCSCTIVGRTSTCATDGHKYTSTTARGHTLAGRCSRITPDLSGRDPICYPICRQDDLHPGSKRLLIQQTGWVPQKGSWFRSFLRYESYSNCGEVNSGERPGSGVGRRHNHTIS